MLMLCSSRIEVFFFFYTSVNLQFLLEREVEEAFDAAHCTALQLPGDAVAGDLEEAIFQAALPDIL